MESVWVLTLSVFGHYIRRRMEVICATNVISRELRPPIAARAYYKGGHIGKAAGGLQALAVSVEY